MQAATLPFSSGWLWIQEGAGIFKRQPMAMFFWSLITGFLITIAYLIPLLGQMALIAAMPILTFITLNAFRNIVANRTMMPGMWLAPLHDIQARRSLLRLGLVYLVICLLGGLVATLPFLDNLMAAVGADGTISQQDLAGAIRGPFVVFGILYLLISALFWHAPALMGWHRIKLAQALFYSMVACWRNKWPFLLYGASWGAIFLVVQLAGNMLVAMGLGTGVVQLILTPVNLIIAAILYCSFYPTYMSVFGDSYSAQPADDATNG
jgi:hypothetical protein